MSVIEQLFSRLPSFHNDGVRSYHIEESVARWLSDHVDHESVTLETGTGYSTVVLAETGAHHIAVSPSASEHELILQWCAQHGVPTRHLHFHCTSSEAWLPRAKLPDLDIVLIDGDHGFPIPIVDWFYTADALEVGGYVLVDDIQLPAPRVLHEFLMSEVDVGRWRYLGEVASGRTSAFQKAHAGWKNPWTEQRFELPGRTSLAGTDSPTRLQLAVRDAQR